jgi:hypothetical protein
MMVDPLWDSIVTSGNLPVSKKAWKTLGRNQGYKELDK